MAHGEMALYIAAARQDILAAGDDLVAKDPDSSARGATCLVRPGSDQLSQSSFNQYPIRKPATRVDPVKSFPSQRSSVL
jgi:hypothetical protein